MKEFKLRYVPAVALALTALACSEQPQGPKDGKADMVQYCVQKNDKGEDVRVEEAKCEAAYQAGRANAMGSVGASSSSGSNSFFWAFAGSYLGSSMGSNRTTIVEYGRPVSGSFYQAPAYSYQSTVRPPANLVPANIASARTYTANRAPAYARSGFSSAGKSAVSSGTSRGGFGTSAGSHASGGGT